MFKSNKLEKIYENLLDKYPEEKEYLNAVKELFESLDILLEQRQDIENSPILEKIVEPERIVKFDVEWVDDNNIKQVNKGYRVQFNSALGPYKGGLRFDPSVNLSILKFLGFEQIFKNALTGLPLGGGKGGSDFTSKGKSDSEIKKFCEAFVEILSPYIGPKLDVPAGDLGCGGKEIEFMALKNKEITGKLDGTFTGKPIYLKGSQLRPEATGYGLLYFVSNMLETYKKDTIKNKKVIISGAGNVSSFAMRKTKELGGIVVGASNSRGYIYDENGIDIDYVIACAENRNNFIPKYLEKYPNTKTSNISKQLWENKCDIALPCATQNEIDINSAKRLYENGCFLVAEGANMPCTLEAIGFFNENGVLFAPGKASNAGGVAVSGLEMQQNEIETYWSKEEVDEKLKQIMKSIFEISYENANKLGKPTDLKLGANIAGFLRVYEQMEKIENSK